MVSWFTRLIVGPLLIRASAALPAEETKTHPDTSGTNEGIAFLEQAYGARTKADAEEWKQRVKAKQAGLAATLDQLIANDRGEDALRFAVPFAYFLSSANQQKEALQILTRVLQLPSAKGATSIRARALYEAGLLAFRQRDQTRSRALNEESLRAAREVGDNAIAATALIGLSRNALREHDYKTVKDLAQEAAEMREKLGDTAGRISAMHMVAAAARMEGDDARAEQIYESTLATYRATGDKRRAAGEVCNLGFVYLHQGKVPKALEQFKGALEEFRAIKDEPGIAYCLTGFAAVAAVKKEPARAAELYGAAATALERLSITLDPDDQLDWDRYTQLARREMKEAEYAAAFDKGKALAREQAIRLALPNE